MANTRMQSECPRASTSPPSVLERAHMTYGEAPALCLQTPLPVSLTHHISLSLGATDPGTRTLQTADNESREPSCFSRGLLLLGSRLQRGRCHSHVLQDRDHPAEQRRGRESGWGRGTVPRLLKLPATPCSSLQLRPSFISTAGSLTGLSATLSALSSHHSGSRWHAFPTALPGS